MISTAQEAVKALNDAQFREFRTWLDLHEVQRVAAPFVVAREDEIARDYHSVNPPTIDEVTKFPIWKQPLGAHDAWPISAQVSHGGSVWENISGVPNVWEPGNDGPVPTWMNITDSVIDPPEPPEDPGEPGEDPEDPETPAVEPWDPNGRDYVTGDLVTHDGVTYSVVQDHTSQPGWTPDTLPSLYAPVTV